MNAYRYAAGSEVEPDPFPPAEGEEDMEPVFLDLLGAGFPMEVRLDQLRIRVGRYEWSFVSVSDFWTAFDFAKLHECSMSRARMRCGLLR